MFKIIVSNTAFLISLILCFSFSFFGFIYFYNSNYQFISSIGHNWSTGPISNASLGGEICPMGKISIINDFWQGTSSGCFCKNTFFFENSHITKGACSKKTNNCFDINEIPKIPLKTWKGMNICVNRGPNYLDLKTAKTPERCGLGFKSCGIIDSLNNVLCYPHLLECPYNFMKAIPINEIIPNDKKYKILSLNKISDIKIILSNEDKNGNVLNQFKIDDDTPCLSPDYKNLDVKPYPLENTFGKTLCSNRVGNEVFDNTYHKVDSVSYQRLYNENKINEKLSLLPKFSSDYNYLHKNTNLFYKNYIGLEMSCVQKLKENSDSNKIISDILEIETQMSRNTSLFSAALIFTSIGLIITIFFSIFAYWLQLTEEKYYFIYHIAKFFIVSVPLLVVSVMLFNEVTNTFYDLRVLTDPSCTDSNTSVAISDFLQYLNSGKAFTYLLLIYSVVLSLINIVSFF